MFERHCYEMDDGRFYIFDRRRGMAAQSDYRDKRNLDTEKALAVCTDREIAERIVRLLNADAAQLERQGARVA